MSTATKTRPDHRVRRVTPPRPIPIEAPDERPPVAEVLLTIRNDTIVNADLYLGQVVVPLGGE